MSKFDNVGLITKHRLQQNGDGGVRILVPCFFGLLWKTAKVIYRSWAGCDYYDAVFPTATEACTAIHEHNEAWTAALDAKHRQNSWREIPDCAEEG